MPTTELTTRRIPAPRHTFRTYVVLVDGVKTAEIGPQSDSPEKVIECKFELASGSHDVAIALNWNFNCRASNVVRIDGDGDPVVLEARANNTGIILDLALWFDWLWWYIELTGKEIYLSRVAR